MPRLDSEHVKGTDEDTCRFCWKPFPMGLYLTAFCPYCGEMNSSFSRDTYQHYFECTIEEFRKQFCYEQHQDDELRARAAATFFIENFRKDQVELEESEQQFFQELLDRTDECGLEFSFCYQCGIKF